MYDQLCMAKLMTLSLAQVAWSTQVLNCAHHVSDAGSSALNSYPSPFSADIQANEESQQLIVTYLVVGTHGTGEIHVTAENNMGSEGAELELSKADFTIDGSKDVVKLVKGKRRTMDV